MKKLFALLLALVMSLSLAACGGGGDAAPDEEEPAVSEEPEEAEPNDAELVPDAVQGVWCDTGTEGVLSLYSFKDKRIENYAITCGRGGAKILSGTYTVKDGKLNYYYSDSTGYSTYTYSDGVLALFNASGKEIQQLTAADMMDYLTQEEGSANHDGVICLAELIVKHFPDSAESATATEKKEAANAAIKAAGEAALQKLNTTYDKVQQLTWYLHKDQPKYTDICCYMYPYIGRMDDGQTWLRVALNYTDAKTDAGWIFFKTVIFSVDGKNTTKVFNYNDILRDNDTEVWEVADFEPNATEIQLLRDIAASNETILRFQGDEYHVDHVVTDKEKAAITDVLSAYEYLTSQSR